LAWRLLKEKAAWFNDEWASGSNQQYVGVCVQPCVDG
jgi:hypothetical protein